MQTLTLTPQQAPAETARLAGTFLDERAMTTRITTDADVFREDGTPLLLFRKRCLPRGAALAAWAGLREAAVPANNRGTAAGRFLVSDFPGAVRISATRVRKRRRDGTLSRRDYAGRVVQSGIVGAVERTTYNPYCRLTAYALNYPERLAAALPYIQAIDETFAALLPERHAAQLAVLKEAHPDFHLTGTAFSTVTVNRNFQTAVHRDEGDLAEGFGVMTVLRGGDYSGGWLLFPRYRVGVWMDTCDLLLADVHEWHGNTPIRGLPGQYERISLVLYMREGVRYCGAAQAELTHARRRTAGTPLKRVRVE